MTNVEPKRGLLRAGALLILVGCFQALAQSPRGPQIAVLPPPAVTWTQEQDQQNMKDQLGISVLRPGASGNKQDPNHQGSFMATVAAQPVYQLLGARTLGVSSNYHLEKMPPVNTGLLEGALAWRQHDGGHTDAPNMKYFIEANRDVSDPVGLSHWSGDRSASY